MTRNRLFLITTSAACLSLVAAVAATRPSEPAPVTAAPATYTIDAVHSTALFRVHHLGAGQFWGRFNTLEGTFEYDETGDSLSLDVSIPIESIDTATENLDRHLKSPDFFNAREYPAMTFKSESAKKVGDGRYKVMGTLTIRDIAQPVTADVEFTGKASGPRGTRCGLEATFTVQRSKHGVMYGVENKMLGDDVRVIVGLEGVGASDDG